MATGTIKFYDVFRAYGYITPDEGGRDVYFHPKALKEAGIDSVEPRQAVSYDTKKEGNHRIVAVNIRLKEHQF